MTSKNKLLEVIKLFFVIALSGVIIFIAVLLYKNLNEAGKLKSVSEKVPKEYTAVDKKERENADRAPSGNSGILGFDEGNEDSAENWAQDDLKLPMTVSSISFFRISGTEIQITWTPPEDGTVKEYIIAKRRKAAAEKEDEWMELARPGKGDTSYTDVLSDDAPMRYEYRLIALPEENSDYAPGEMDILASNVMICIDPGHYEGINAMDCGEPYTYKEGDFTLSIGLKLKDILRADYGIDAYMTREGPSINIYGLSDGAIDMGHISYRGVYAQEKNSNLFVSLHTNANQDNVNDSPTLFQPVGITKTLVIANVMAMNTPGALKIGDEIGEELSRVNYSLGISASPDFLPSADNGVIPWSDELNDSLNTPGAVVCRLSGTEDYYGVLNGSNRAGVPGFIIEHAHHTVPEMRREAMEGTLAEQWARADALGIARGFGFADD